MKTFTLQKFGKAPFLSLWKSIPNKKKSLTKRMIYFLLFSFLVPTISYAQTVDKKRGYSKSEVIVDADYLKMKQEFNQKKNLVIVDNTDEKCGFTIVEEALQEAYPNRGNDQRFEHWMKEKIAERKSGNYFTSTTVTIPVVVHVIHDGDAEGVGSNISEAQILSQIDILNEDFRRLNADAANTPADFLSVAADSKIEFCLAIVDPDGNVSNGIHRYDGGQSVYSISDMENTIKPATYWNPDYYFNIWVCPLQNYLGYAQFPSTSGLPGMPVDGGPAETDGIVCTHPSFGNTGTATYPFDLGRTATHEAGHFFGLRHIWGDGGCSVDDHVTDTPTHGGANYTGGPCTYPGPNSCIDAGTDYPDMFMNYMDYSNDECMNMFTLGQKERFEVVMSNSPRRNYENSQVCQGIAPGSENDLCENAIPIFCGESVFGSTSSATLDAVGDCGTPTSAPGVWYSFVATSTIANLSTCNQANYDTKISVFTGSCDAPVCVGGQDDDLSNCTGFTTNLNVHTIPGETYFVLVHGFANATGDFTLTMTCLEGPDNDLCENAIPIYCGDVVNGNTELASNIGAQTDCSEDIWDDNPGFGVWYTIEGTGGDITLSLCDAANYDTRIDVFSGTCGDLSCVAGSDIEPQCSGFTSEVTFASIAGETYTVYVHGFQSATGDFTLTVDCLCVADAGECATVYQGYAPAECTDLTASANYGSPPYNYLWSTGETTQTITVCPTTETSYTVTVTDSEGCTSTDDVTVDVIDVRCGKKLNKVEVCHIPPGNPDNAHTICISPNAVETHLAHGDHLGACGIEPCDGLYPDNIGGSGARQVVQGDENHDEAWNIYPNPAKGSASIDLIAFYEQDVDITIFNATGNVIWRQPSQILETTVVEVDLEKMTPGVYHVVVRTNDQSMAKKLVVTK